MIETIIFWVLAAGAVLGALVVVVPLTVIGPCVLQLGSLAFFFAWLGSMSCFQRTIWLRCR